MKKRYTIACIAVLLCASTVRSQVTPPVNQQISDKPLLFSSLPQKLECNLEEVDRLFMSEPSQKLQLQLNNYLQLDGIVMEKIRRSPEVLSVNFKTLNYDGALFNISRIIQNGTIRYSGRIINKENGDVLTLVKENEKYYFTKMAQRFTMVE
jgi:hypothetical protein